MASTTPCPTPPCSHLQAYRSACAPRAGNGVLPCGTRPFRSLQRCIRVRPLGGRAEVRRDPDEVPRCGSCGSTGPRLYACLTCAALSCRPHAPEHAASNRAASDSLHDIAIDVDRAELFCCACGDHVYDPDFDATVVLAQKEASFPLASHSSPPPAPLVVRGTMWKRRRVEYRPWSPDPRELSLMGRRSTPLGLAQSSTCGGGLSTSASVSPACFPLGLRGLNNLGNTCFMNSVLQVLLHVPPLRNFFLSDRHNRHLCQQQKSNKKGIGNTNIVVGTNRHRIGRNSNGNISSNANGAGNAQTLRTMCLACDLDAMYSAVFSGDRKPYSPAKVLYSWWQHASNLAGYEQQDAHEFFISILDGIHEMVEQHQRKPRSQGSGECCIAHRVFYGILRSDVTCTICGFTSTTYDPCIDIPLDLDSSCTPMKTVIMKALPCNGEMEAALSSTSTLVGCLEHFTRPERLGSDQKLFCQHCQVRQESLKQMSIRRLPLVTCFHIKRFEHSSMRKKSRKIDQYLQFPFSLNMGHYMSSSILRSRLGNRMFAINSDDSDASPELAAEFELFAVITHSGALDCGHYVTYLRLNNLWYRCDDARITSVSENTVRAAQAYMLFYAQKMFFYKARESVVAS